MKTEMIEKITSTLKPFAQLMNEVQGETLSTAESIAICEILLSISKLAAVWEISEE